MKSTDAIDLMIQEFGRQAKEEQPFMLVDDGIELIQAEIDDLCFSPTPDKEILQEIAVRLAATAFRFLVDLC